MTAQRSFGRGGRDGECRPLSTGAAVRAALALVLLLTPLLRSALSSAGHLEHSRFRQELRSGNVERVTLRGSRVSGRLAEPIERSGSGEALRDFVTHVPAFGDDELLAENDIAITVHPVKEPGSWLPDARLAEPLD